MKNTIPLLLLLLSWMFSASPANAQCPGNKVYACRYDACGFQECKCVSLVSLQNWLATVPPCNWKPPKWFVRKYEPGAGMENSLQVYPNPVSNATAISFSLIESQTVSVRILDMNGREVAIIANRVFDAGRYNLTWSREHIRGGIYLLQLRSEEHNETVKLVVTN